MRREIEENRGMGLRTSRMGSAPSNGARPPQHRRRTAKRSFSSFLVCGASSSTHEMENYPAELLVNSAELGDGKKLKYKGNSSDQSLSSGAALVDIKIENRVLSGRCLTADEHPGPEASPVNVGPGDEEKCLCESSELVPCQSMVTSRVNDTASTSCIDQPLPDHMHATETVNLDAVKDINNSLNEHSSQIVEASSIANSLPSHSRTNSLSDEVSEFGFSSDVSGSPIEFHLMSDDSRQEVIPSAIEFLVPEREQNRQERSLIQGDIMGVSSGTLSSNSSEMSSQDARRNSRRLFWDAFSRRSPGRDSVSGGLLSSSDESDFLRSQDRLLLDVNGNFISDERRGDIRSRGIRIEGSNEPRWNSRSEMLERFRDGLDSTDLRAAICPRRIHADGSCSCQSALPTEESSSHAISRVVLLAQALFEVLNHMQRQPMFSRPLASLPAPESVIDSFPVKIHRKETILECAQDVPQCYICLADYEEGDKIRVLPCHHEYHMSCVDKWLQEFHGVCPLCRDDVCQGVTAASVSNREILSH